MGLKTKRISGGKKVIIFREREKKKRVCSPRYLPALFFKKIYFKCKVGTQTPKKQSKS
jgi:hypothetical protein